MKQAERHILDGCHPRVLADGYEIAKNECLQFLEKFKVPIDDIDKNTMILRNIAKTSLSTKLPPELANLLVDIIVEAI